MVTSLDSLQQHHGFIPKCSKIGAEISAEISAQVARFKFGEHHCGMVKKLVNDH